MTLNTSKKSQATDTVILVTSESEAIFYFKTMPCFLWKFHHRDVKTLWGNVLEDTILALTATTIAPTFILSLFATLDVLKILASILVYLCPGGA